jgi:catechol 2,3-dioxygenase-like lactoylglutathione lyase family enzyme
MKIKAFEHVGVSVSNLERSIQFYRDMLGMQFLRQRQFSGDHYGQIMGLKSPLGKLAIMESGPMRLELFEFENPAPKIGDLERPVCDHGITHFCVEVANLDQEYERMVAGGVSFHCPPLDFPGIAKATYGRDPDGNVFELIERYSSTTT